METLLYNAGPIAHMSGHDVLSGNFSADDLVYDNGLAIYVKNGIIARIEETTELIEEFNGIEKIDLEGKALVPGLVDAHTHLLWAGDRSKEIVWKQQGKTYSEIASLGGGIASTVKSTRNISSEDLTKIGVDRLGKALKFGTTHLEAKSGYGLTTESELKLLNVGNSISSLEGLPTVDLTWLGAHATPKGMSYAEYTEQILSDQLPSIIDQGLARSADVFCEPGWFSIEQTEEIMKESRRLGLDLRLHVDEFSDGGGGDLASDLRVTTADHAHYTSPDSREKMESKGVNTGFLPGTPYSMGENYPPFQDCCDNNWRWTIASDFNPNCRTLNLPFLASILVQRNEISPIIALAACTVNSAKTTPHPSGLAHGKIEVGSVANLNIVNSENWEAWCLQPGMSPFESTMVNGNMIYH